MAKELNYELYRFEQEEERETRQVAGADGVVTEESILIQPHLLITAELLLTLDEYKEENYTKIRYRVKYAITSNTEDVEASTYSISANNYAASTQKPYIKVVDEFGDEAGGSLTDYQRLYAEYNKINNAIFYVGEETYKSYHTYYHRLDGTRALTFNIKATFQPKGIEAITQTTVVINKTINVVLDNDRKNIIVTATSFTDEELASFTYSLTTGKSIIEYKSGSTSNRDDTIIGLQAALSFDGVTPDIPYRDIAIDGGTYTFDFTEQEREILRVKAQGSDTVPIYYLTKTTRQVTYSSTNYVETVDLIGSTQRVLTVVGCNPSLNPTVKDVNSDTLALTGDENTFIRYESMAEFAINAVASKHATIVSQSVQCGSKKISNLPYGVIDDTESGTFVFEITDSRGMGAASSVFKNLIEYVKPTCYQKVEMMLSGETSVNVKMSVSGSYYSGSFGVADNDFTYQVRHTDKSGNMGDWFTVEVEPTFNGSAYELECTLSGFDYGTAYTFQSRVIDKLNTVQSSQYTIRYLPIFDWSETDFNFNVSVNIENELSMSGNTVLRYNKDNDNTVLSAGGGNIYIRPNGTDDTSSETVFYGNGNINFGGTVNFGDGFTVDGNELADYVIESGSEAMGSNGTWYWCKWASGKAECWGCRNFGNMAVNTAWGGLYRSAILTQDLPEKVFKTTPDVISINIVNSNYGGWICKHENSAPSAVTTGSFIFVRPASATVTPTYIGFHIIGVWQ